ncbi:lipopolysaccharide biosynthesis protein [Nitrobacteraceae bacterium UC4446_H13]
MSFLANARTMLGGFAAAQVIGMAAMPLLTRIYSPEAFGFQALLVALATVLSLCATLRLDLALLLATDEEEGELLGLIGCIAVFVIALIVIVLLLFGDKISLRVGAASAGWLWLVLPMMMALIATQVATALLSRRKEFRPIARATLLTQASYVLAAVGSALPFGNSGLACSKMIGGVIGAVSLVRRGTAGAALQLPTAGRVSHLWGRFRQFAIFNTPYSLIGTLTREMPIYLFTAVSANAAAGFYGLARMLLSLPALLATAALSQVFYREAAEWWGKPRLEALVTGLLGLSMRASAPVFAVICVWGDTFFDAVFGTSWRQAGIYAMVLAPAAWLALQTSWPERMFEVAMRQDVSFKIQITFDSLTIITVIIPLALKYDPIFSVVGWSICNVIYHLSYLMGIFAVSRFNMPLLRQIVISSTALFAGSCLLFSIWRFFLGDNFWSGAGCAAVASAFALVVILKNMSYVKTISGSPEKIA